MGEVFMTAGIITAIVLCLVGIVKLPFATFKTNRPKLYKATFTLLSILLSIAICLVTQAFLLDGAIASTNFAILLITTFAGVLGLYSSYEGLGLKVLVKNLLEKIQELSSKAPESKFTKCVEKIGIDKALEIIELQKQIDAKKETEATLVETLVETPVETPVETIDAVAPIEENQAPVDTQVKNEV